MLVSLLSSRWSSLSAGQPWDVDDDYDEDDEDEDDKDDKDDKDENDKDENDNDDDVVLKVELP